MKRSSSYWLSVVLVLIGASSFGVMSPVIKQVYDRGFSFEQVTVHQVGAAMVLLWLLVLCFPKQRRNPLRGSWLMLALTGIAGLALSTILFNKALQKLDASLATVLLFQFTWITILLDSLRNRKVPARNRLLAVVIVLIGTVLAVGLLEGRLEHNDPAGIGYGLAAAVTYSLFLSLTGSVKSSLGVLMDSAVMLTGGFVFVMLLMGSEAWAGEREPSLLLWALLLALLGQVAPAVLFNAGIPRIGSSLAALLGSVELPVASAAAWLIGGETSSIVQIAGVILILAGIVLAQRTGNTNDKPASLEE
ncbi:EamA family transporter [Paenibacillus beijingensis]|uniref:EamA domain-containing protein n=1 Tax=Paenibacillus beijingensis TaxID=1126833 RepID=A0A0D5NJY7_9BACL|nr:DMT family transporter [Paenibacillus beijingensis]AJY75312.1 hypothetical protein VN24_12935 [Paenibacillus beijingensis]